MNDICQRNCQRLMYIINDALRNFVTLACQEKYLFDSNTFGPGACDTPDSGLGLWILNGKSDHCARNCLRRGNGFKMAVASARTLRAILFDDHMPDFPGCTGGAMIDVAVDD